ncbi:MAG TPA: DNA-protecting protein DprA [Bacteroidetes bacterium]|nr:DNA-protecting protein DprA [Bacteroidota bacterium]HRK04175.1 DNA-processing protein DprA [Chlorobiota bacterium]
METRLQHQRDIVFGLTYLRSLTAAEAITLAMEAEDLRDAAERLGMSALLTDDILADMERQHERVAALQARITTWFDDDYPQRLRQMHAPPAVLFVHGTLPPESLPHIAVVGTRSCSVQYGMPVTRTLVRDWTDRSCVIVSGLAAGIDTVAHEEAVRNGGQTIAVVASGLDRITPTDARRLADRIIDGHGCVMTEYRCGQGAMPQNFPARNRIICGMSDAVVVTESKAKGGALITAAFAVRDGRPLYAVPGPITSTRSAGTNALLRTTAARVLTSSQDLVEDLGWSTHQRSPETLELDLDPSERQVYDVLGDDTLHADEIAVACGRPAHDVLADLLSLELRRVVTTRPGSRWCRLS